MTRFLAVAVLILAVAACDSSVPAPTGPSLTELELVYHSQLSITTEGYEYVDPDENCLFGPYDGQGGGYLEAGRLRFGDGGRFEFYAETALQQSETVERDTLTVTGNYERHGPLLELRLDAGDHVWYGTVGPHPESPTTVVLGDYSDQGSAFGAAQPSGLNGRDCGLAMFTPEGVEPDRSIVSEPGARAESFDFVGVIASWGYQEVPLRFGRQANNMIEGGTLTLRPDGTYHILILDVEGDNYHPTNTWRSDKESEGTYVDHGGLLAFDVGTAAMGFGWSDGDTLRVGVEQGPTWPIRVWDTTDRILVRN
ncbi:hypothetical protein [Rubrivirga sp.]|uniref:hypothetical protein n=1 Tax=Rubrivirga sp. TaxID=1885344 RepID=UPI003C77F87C